MQLVLEKLGFACRRLVISLLFMHVVILLLHLAEIAMSHQGYSPSIISYSILADAAYIGQLALTVGIAYYVLYLLSDFIARMLLAMLFIVLITMQMGLMQYFLTSSTLLGADFWTYSMEDITFTIKASAEIKWWQLLIIPVFIGIAMRMHYAMQQYTLPIIPSVVIYTGYIILFIIAQSNFIPQKKDIASRNLSTNKSAYFIEKSIQLWRDETDQIADELIAGDHEFPFQRIHDTTDLLGNYLHKTPIPPNVVMVVVEGLGKTFVGNNAEYGGAMPFLDSLTNQGLFWSNFLSTTGRTFGIIPSLTASLPYGKSGFMELEEYPYHTSIIKILKQNGYYTSFFYGGDAKFDGQKKFLQQQEIDQIIDEYEFDDQYIKIPPTKDGFSWGYQDAEVYKRSFEQKRPKQPYLDLFLTVTSHEPFLFSGIEKYQQRFNNFLAKATNKTEIKANENAFKTLMYADDALRYLIETYQTKPEFRNTIFVITGDHRMIPVKHKNDIDRFHVPFLIYSPLVKQPVQFKSISSHSDWAATITTYLQRNHNIQVPDSVHWIGKGLTFDKKFSGNEQLVIMKNKGDMSDMIYGDKFLTGGYLYQLADNLQVSPVDDSELKEKVETFLKAFKNINHYVCANNKLYHYNGLISTTLNKLNIDSLERLIDSVEKPTIAKQPIPSNTQATTQNNFKPTTTTLAKPLKPNTQNAPSASTNRKAITEANKGEAPYIMGKVYADLKNYAKAKELFQKALQFNYKPQDVYKQLMAIEIETNNKAEALSLYQNATAQYGSAPFKIEWIKINAMDDKK